MLGNKRVKNFKISDQAKKLQKITKKWKNALKNNEETIVIGDLNIYGNTLYDDVNKFTRYEKQMMPLTKIISEDLIENGMNLLNKEHTFKMGDITTHLDLTLTNRSEKYPKYTMMVILHQTIKQ